MSLDLEIQTPLDLLCAGAVNMAYQIDKLGTVISKPALCTCTIKTSDELCISSV